MSSCRILLATLLLIGCRQINGWTPVNRHGLLPSPPRGTLLAARNGNPSSSENDRILTDRQRRKIWQKAAAQVASIGLGAAAVAVWTRPVWAAGRSRTGGYTVQKSAAEWKSSLSPIQHQILRERGTERPNSSILANEKRLGVFVCAGCGARLFSSKDKFESGTGWPSFARGLEDVEIESVDPITANLAGAELRCRRCGGHLGDVFNDGFLFVGSEAQKTGKRFFIDGTALVFEPESGEPSLRGDAPKPIDKGPSWLDPPTIAPRD